MNGPANISSSQPPAFSEVVDVSIIIVNWNTREVLHNCLASIYAETQNLSFEVIVIDNASLDASAEMVRSQFPQTHLIANVHNTGFAAANNQGLRIARGRYLLLLNPDTLILDAAIQKTVQYADRHTDIGVIGCQVLETLDRIQRTCFKFPSPLNTFLYATGLAGTFPHSRFFARAQMGEWDRKDERDVEVVSGMYMLVRREAFAQVGLMDESYFIYAEEADWCYRFWKAGWRCVFTPCAQIIHLDGGSKSTSQVSVKMFLQLQKSLLLFHKKNLGWPAWAVTKFLYIGSMLLRASLGYAGAFLKLGETSSKRAAQAAAALKFHLWGMES